MEDRTTVPVAWLQPGETPRLGGEDLDHVRVLMECEDDLPPILVHRDTMHVVDGRHRLQAARRRGDEMIGVRFFDGDTDEAFIAAVSANQDHGLPLTLADRTAAATRILARCPGRSDRSVAAITGLSATTVATIRRQHGYGTDGRGRAGRDGRVRPLNPAEGRRRAGELITAQPDASLRQIAKLAGVSPATVRDVRDRLRRGDDPVPVRQLSQGRRPAGAGAGETVRAPADAPAAPVADREDVLRKLTKDPSLRFTDSGRELLRMLFAHARGPAGWQTFLSQIPPHSSYLVAELARACAAEWLTFAAQLERRLDVDPQALDPMRTASGQ